MPVLSCWRSRAGRVVIDRPGLYPLTADLAASRPAERWPHGVWVALLACHRGDFIATRVLGHESTTRHAVRVNGRPLDELEQLWGDVSIELGAGGPEVCRLEYLHRDGPALEFVIPMFSSLRCAYSDRPLRGRTVARCSGCYRLFARDAWAELEETCPACAWSPREAATGTPHRHTV